jgi:ABC-type multidrug transport system ATPase subunit
MADEQDRRGRGPELVLEPALGWYVEVVVRPLLDGVSLRVGEGAKVALIGPSGTGKTSGS